MDNAANGVDVQRFDFACHRRDHHCAVYAVFQANSR
ncbi:hypothetical protein D018_4178A, partial [Vibrio parahaemolyticus VP2007-007]